MDGQAPSGVTGRWIQAKRAQVRQHAYGIRNGCVCRAGKGRQLKNTGEQERQPLTIGHAAGDDHAPRRLGPRAERHHGCDHPAITGS